MKYNNSGKVRIYPNDRDPLWQECKRRFLIEVRAPPDPVAIHDSQNFYYKNTRGRLKVTDYEWYLLDNEMLIREKKIGS